jgi:hypothetical protein
MTNIDRQRRRLDALENPQRGKRRTHIVWWDEKESESVVRLRVERMIAQGKAKRDDRFFYVSWPTAETDLPSYRAGEPGPGAL